MLSIADRFTAWLTRRAERRVKKLMFALHPDTFDRGCAYVAMGAEDIEAFLFTQGEVLGSIGVFAADDGYEIEVVDKAEVLDDAE